MSTKIGVTIRVRPFLEHEKRSSSQASRLQIFPNEKEIRILNDDMSGYKSFKFDKVFDQETTQDQLYNQAQIQDLVNKVVEGYHSTIFAYGQTGSGKTYTMEGYKYEVNQTETDLITTPNPYGKDAGIIPRSIKTLFDTIKTYSKLYHRTYTIYNEKIYDLLNPTQMSNTSYNKPGAGLRLRWTSKDQFAVENLFVFECKTQEEVMTLFHQGLRNKIMASHKLNLSSSRSHCMLSLRVESVDTKTSENLIVSKLDLVDLAGSERTSMTGNESQIAQKESIEINKSLFTLRQVISTLADIQKSPTEKNNKEKLHVPYRDSKLTCLLKQSIGGNSYCLMIACLAPGDRFFEENLSTLTYATKAAYISNEPTKNEDPKTRMITDLKGQVACLTKELERANGHITFLSQLAGEKIKSYTGDLPLSQKESSNGFKLTSLQLGKNNENQRNLASRTSEKSTTQGSSFNKKGVVETQKIIGTVIKQEPSNNMSDKSSVASEEIRPQEYFNQRLIESINTVKELLKSNKEIREKMTKLENLNENLQGELFQVVYLFQLHKENQDLREKLGVFESLFNNRGISQNTATNEEDISLVEERVDSNIPDLANEKKGQETIEDIINLRRFKKTLGSKPNRDSEAENGSMQQKIFPPSYLLKGRKKYLPNETMFVPPHYSQAQGFKTKYAQKSAYDAQNDASPSEAIKTKRSNTPSQVEFKPMDVLLGITKTGFDGFNESRKQSSPEISHKTKQKDTGINGSYLPQLREHSLEINNDALNNSAVDVSLESMKKTSNVWLSGFIKRRAHSTLKKTRNDDKSINKTPSEMSRIQMLLMKGQEV